MDLPFLKYLDDPQSTYTVSHLSHYPITLISTPESCANSLHPRHGLTTVFHMGMALLALPGSSPLPEPSPQDSIFHGELSILLGKKYVPRVLFLIPEGYLNIPTNQDS